MNEQKCASVFERKTMKNTYKWLGSKQRHVTWHLKLNDSFLIQEYFHEMR